MARPSWPRPVRAVGTVTGSVVAMVAWAAVAHSSGSGWVQALGILVAATLVVGLTVPALPLLRTSATVADAPADGRAGQALTLVMRTSRPARITPVSPPGAPATGQGPGQGPRTVRVACTPARRGVLDTVVVEVASSAPFGLVWWSRRMALPLPRPLVVAPRWGRPTGLRPGPGPVPEGSHRPDRTTGGDPAGVRPYAAGDPLRSVHWPATAHAGALMVRETEHPRREPIVIELLLPDDPDAAEQAAEACMASVPTLLDGSRTVVLATDEAVDGPSAAAPARAVVRPVVDPLDLGRRLGRAVSRRPPGAGP